MCLAQGPKYSDAGEAQTRGPYVSSQALYHCAPRGGPMFFLAKIIICQGSRGGPTFSGGGGGGGGVQLFPGVGGGGVPNANFYRNLSNLGFYRRGDRLSPLWIPACSAFTCSSDSLIDLHMLSVSKLGWTGRSFLKSHQCHSVVSLSKTHLSFNPGKPIPT